VQNLYYDTVDWDIVRESIEKPLYKEKLRLRYYDQYSPESQGFLELKKKYDGIVYKRRIAFPLGNLNSHCVREIVSAADSQISREIGFFLQSNAVSEKIYIAYKRTAYNGMEDKGLRVTFDKDIVFNVSRLDSFNSGVGCQILNQNQMIMEIKTLGAIPLWLTQVLSKNNIFPGSFSKVGICYAEYIFKQAPEGVKNVA
jgi:SPX domain protein involved in polyphosphate accumulation